MATVWKQDPFWTQRIGGLTWILGNAPAHLTLRCQPFASNEPSRCTGGQRKYLAGEGSYSGGRRQDEEHFFLQPTLLWWQHKQHKRSSCSPDYRLEGAGEVLWLNNFYKPGWQTGRRAPTSESSLPDLADLGRPVGPKMVVTAVTVSTICQQGKLTEAVEALEVLAQTDCPISKSLFYTVLKECVAKKDLDLGRRVHALTVKKGYESDTFLCNHILRMYASHDRLQEAMDVFTPVARPDAFMWSSIISAHVKHGQAKQAIQLYHQMRSSSGKPDGHVFVAALQACARGGDLETGQQVHADVLASGVEPDLFVISCLVNMYAKCGSLQDAQSVFDRLPQKSVATWNAMIAGYSQQGMGHEALYLYSAMEEEGTALPDSVTFVGILQACASLGTPALEKGKRLHAQIVKRGLEADVVVGGSLVNMYAKCSSLQDAQRVFEKLPHKSVVTWNSMITGYAHQGMGQEALHIYSAMQEEGIAIPNSVTFVCLLQACASVGTMALQKGKQLHAQIREQGIECDVVVGGSLVNMYAKCGSLQDAQIVFDNLPQKTVVTWNAMITGYSQQSMGQEALHLYSAMQEEDIAIPNPVTFVCLLQACASVGTVALQKGKQLHAQIREQGIERDVGVGGSLVNMYAKCGSLQDAQSVFDRLPQKSVVTWNAIIAGYSQQGMGREALHLYSAMQEEDIAIPNSVTFIGILQACATVGTLALEKGKHLHTQIRERGLEADVVVGGSLVNMYAKCGSLQDAQSVFDRLPQKTVVTWTAMISGYSQQGMGEEALHLYSALQEEGIVIPNSVTFVCLLQACASMGTVALEKGMQLHAQIGERGLEADVVVGGSLVNMYAKCGSLQHAESVFDRLPQKSVVTWTAMIAGYSQQGMGQKALHLFSAMQEEGIAIPNSVTFVCLLQACAIVGTPALEKGRVLHKQIGEQGLEADVFVGGSLINMYAKCGSVPDAQSVFDRLPQKSPVTWNAMIAGYSQQGMGREALHLYSAMQQVSIAIPDSVTFVCLLQACASVAALDTGRELHAQIERQGLQADGVVGGSLINMYAKCGSMADAQQVFDAMPERDIAIWGALIAGYTRQGDTEVVFDLVHRMREDDIQPDSITFLSVLTVCSHAGLVNKGKAFFDDMTRHSGITPTEDHYTCMVDLLGRAGQLDEALELARTMPVKPNDVVWHTLLGACRKWSNVEVGLHAFNEAVKLDEKDAAAYVLMCNIYTGAQMWEEAQKMQERRKEIGAWKQPGQSWWTDMSGRVHAFLVGDKEHPESDGIYARLKQLVPKMKKEGYVPHLESSLRGVSDIEKEAHLCGHSEKLAIAYALNKTPEGTTIRIVKNLRVCDDCHRATAYISKIENRTIICRDASRFHVYKDGKCSCGDYW